VSFSVIATGPGLIFYQWQKNAKNLVGETNAILSLTNVQESDVGDYTVLVSNATGAVLSEPAHLTLPAQVGPGSLDLSFNPAPPPVRGIYGYDYSIGLSLLQADGNIIVSGGYDNGMKVWQLNSHGGFVKTVFDNLDGSVNALANLLDGRVLLSYKQFYHGMNPIFGFDPDGTNFTVFSPAYSISGSGGGISGDVQCMAVQTDGKVLVGGSFFIRPLNKVGLMRFNPDGSMDNLKDILVPSVPPQGAGPAPCVPVNRLAALPDNRILFSTSYADANWVPRAMLARTHTDGSLDDSFNVVTNGGINLLAVDAAQRILVAGDFTQILGVPRNHIARLLPDGQLDTNFDPGSGPDDTISCLAVQLNGKIWVGGGFTNWNGFPSHCIAKLNSDGSRDGSFDPGTGAGNPGNRAVVTSVALEANGDLLIGGIFSSFNDIPRAYLARLHGDPAPPLLRLSEGRWSNGEFSFRLQGPNGGRYALQTSTNLVDWQGWTNVQMSGSSLVLTNIVSTTNTTPRFYRAAAE
jgi:uncharacterized delta-60 repeat protein